MFLVFRSCSLVEDVLVGSDTHISDNAVISKSQIGRNCTIGNNVVITGSYIMNNVVIKDNCKIYNTFIDDNCIVADKCILEGGTIIASNVNIKSGSQLKGILVESSESDKENGWYRKIFPYKLTKKRFLGNYLNFYCR